MKEASKKGAFSSAGRSLLHMLVHSNPLYTWELYQAYKTVAREASRSINHFLQYEILCHKVQGSYPVPKSDVEQLLIEILSYLHHWKPNSLACHECFFVPLSYYPWHLMLSIATLHLLRLARAWKLVKLSIVWALNESLWTPSIKLLKFVSLTSKLDL